MGESREALKQMQWKQHSHSILHSVPRKVNCSVRTFALGLSLKEQSKCLAHGIMLSHCDVGNFNHNGLRLKYQHVDLTTKCIYSLFRLMAAGRTLLPLHQSLHLPEILEALIQMRQIKFLGPVEERKEVISVTCQCCSFFCQYF